jgi:tetratricopeptide (TPR) repeat protein
VSLAENFGPASIYNTMTFFTRIGNWGKRMAASFLRGGIHARLRREQYGSVRDMALRALALHRDLGEDEEFSDMARTAATASYFLGDYRNALQYGWVAFRCDRRRGDRLAMCQSLAVVTGATLKLSDLPRALARAEKALALGRELGDPQAIASGLGNLSQVYAALRRYREAVTCVKESLQIMEEAGLARERDYIVGLNGLGLLYRDLNEEDLAQKQFDRGLALAEEIGDRTLRALLLAHVSVAHWSDRDLGAALSLHLKALEAAAELNDAQGVILNLHNIGRCLLEAGRFESALYAVRQMRAVLGAQAEAIELPGAHLLTARLHSRVCLAMGRLEEAKAAGEEAWSLTLKHGMSIGGEYVALELARVCVALKEHARAAELIQLTIDAGEDIRDDLHDEDGFRISLFESHSEAYQDLQWVQVELGDAETALVTAERGRARTLSRALARRESTADSPPDLDLIRRTAEKLGTTFVVYSIIRNPPDQIKLKSDPYFFIWVVPPDPTKPITFHRSGPLLDTLPDGTPSIAENFLGDAAPSRHFVEATPSIDAEMELRWMHAWLIEPVEEALPDSPEALLTFVSTGALLVVPFAALPDRNGVRLIEKHTIAVTPSIQTLLLTAEHESKGEGVLAVTTSGGSTFLRGAEREAWMVAKRFGTKPLRRTKATPEAVRTEMPGKRILHFATHAVFDEAGVESYYGALLLAGGRLTAAEIRDMSLSADLAVLSACETGQGRIAAEGLLGLSRAFMLAGVPSVIATLWKIPDRCTETLMTHFYDHLKEGKARALRQAMRKTMADGFRDARDWAGFVLIGHTGWSSDP